MSKTTENLGLFKYDPSTDGAQTFNIEKALNENWDKLDAAVLLALAAAAPYSAKTYALGAYCTRGGRLYRCTTAITAAETWTAGHWTETTVTAELIAHATSKSNPHGVTAAQTGAYSKSETDTLLANKVRKSTGGQVTVGVDANTLFAEGSYICGSSSLSASDNASINLPPENGWFSINVYATLDYIGNGCVQVAYNRDSANMYKRRLVNNSWSEWEKIATATDLDTKVSKSGDTMTGDFRLQKTNNGYGWILKNHNANVDFGLKLADLSADGSQVAIVLRALNRDVMFECDGALYNLLHSANAQALGFPKIAIGSYVGTGTYSSANANSLTFDFVPKLVIIVADARTNFPGTVFINGQSQSESIGHNYISNYEFTVGWSGNTVTWYTTNSNYGAEAQLNKSGVTYRYIALG